MSFISIRKTSVSTSTSTLVAACIFLFSGFVEALRGDATYYHTGMGSCGARSIDSDYVVALSTPERNNGHCFHHIQIAYQGRTINTTVVDTCPGCSQFSIDLSPAAFAALAPLEAGRIQVDWNYM